MEKKHLIMIVAAIAAVVLIFGLVLGLLGRNQDPQPTEPPGADTTQGTEPGETDPTGNSTEPSTAPATEPTTVPTTEPATEPPTQPATEPTAPSTTDATEPECQHTYKKEVTEPSVDAGGYTTYTCTLCAHSYRDDFTPAITAQELLNGTRLDPAFTGVDILDIQVEMLLGRITDEDATPYEKLQDIQAYQRNELKQANVAVEPLDALEFAEGKIFASANDMIIAYEAYQILESGQGLPDHYAAIFTVLTRAIGLESYVVSGQCGGESHVWNAIRLDGELYYFDAYRKEGTAFLVRESEAEGYVCTDAMSAVTAQQGFAQIKPLTVELKLTDSTGTTTKTYTFDVENSGETASDFMCSTVSVKATGKVSYTLSVTDSTGDFCLVDETGAMHMQKTISGTLSAGADAELTAEEINSLMRIRIEIDN